MALLTNVVSQIISGQNKFCRFCFNNVSEDTNRLHDEVFTPNSKSITTVITTEILNIICCILGDEIAQNISPHDCICQECTESAKKCYQFIKMCKENSAMLVNTIESLDDCSKHVTENLESFNNLFICIDTEDFSNKQFYDNQRTVHSTKTALARFRVLSQHSQKSKNNQSSKRDTRERRIHNYGEELLQMCDILKENNQTKFKCKICSGIFNRSFNFKKHYFSRHCEKSFDCTECDKSYGSEALLKQHVYDSHADIVCSECGKYYRNRYSLLYHMRKHSGVEPYECSYCGMKFQWSSRRAEHIRRYHLEPSAECDICHAKFRTLGSLYEHRKRHFNPNSRLHVMQETPPVEIEAVVEEVVLEST